MMKFKPQPGKPGSWAVDSVLTIRLIISGSKSAAQVCLTVENESEKAHYPITEFYGTDKLDNAQRFLESAGAIQSEI